MEKETPYFDYELKKWLVLYSISIGSGFKFTDLRGKMQKNLGQVIMPLTLCNIISDLQSRDCVKVIERKEPLYKDEGKILKYLGDTTENYYFLTREGKKQLCSGWEFAVSAIPKELYSEALENIRLIYLSIVPPFI